MIVLALPDADGAPVELVPGRGFTSYTVLVQTEADAAETGAEIGSVVDYPVTHPPGAVDEYDDARLAHFRIQKVGVLNPPDGQTEASHSITDVNGVYIYAPVFEAIPPAPVPASVPRLNGMLALDAAGMIPQIEAYMALSGTPSTHKIYWRDLAVFHRDSEIIAVIAAALNVSSNQIDNLFRAAAAIAA